MTKYHKVCSSQTEKHAATPDSRLYTPANSRKKCSEILIKHCCNSKCFGNQKSSIVTQSHNSHPESHSTKVTMCFHCEDFEGHHIGHYHRAGKKVVRRHNGRLVTERLRRPLIHLDDGSELVGYHSRSRLDYIGTLGELRRRSRSAPIRLPMLVPGHGMSWSDDHHGRGYYGGPTRGMMGRGIDDHGYGQHAIFDEPPSSMHRGCGHGYDVGDKFHHYHQQHDHGHLHGQQQPHQHQHVHSFGHYTTSDGMNGRVENREPGFYGR